MFLCLVTKGGAVRLSEILFYAPPLRGVKAFFHYPDTSLSHPSARKLEEGEFSQLPRTTFLRPSRSPPTRVPKKFWQCYCASRSPAAESLTLPRSERESGIERERSPQQHRRFFSFLSPPRELKALNSARKILSAAAAAPFISLPVRMEVSPPK